MATIITVHGTGATGPEHGDRWWQKGSTFEKHLRELVESQDGELKYEPMIWDGANSETARRRAGEELFRKMSTLDANAENYCVVGHSHGGSVISCALLKASTRKDPLKSLRKWITIGTPFLVRNKTPFLFSRLNLIGKSAYLSVLGALVLFVSALVSSLIAESEDLWYTPVLVSAIPPICFYIFLVFYDAKTMYAHNRRYKDYCDNNYADRWVSFWHKSDEAINGLKSLKKVNFGIFQKDFLINPILSLSIFVVPLILISMIVSPGIYAGADGAEEFQGVFAFPLWLMSIGEWYILRWPNPLIGQIPDDLIMPIYSAFNLFIAFPFMLFAFSFCFILFARLIGTGLSPVLSGRLNGLTWRQIRKALFGDDLTGDYTVGAEDKPMWASNGFSWLPDPLSEEIISFSNQEAAKALFKFRGAINKLAFSEEEDNKSDVLSEYLTWNELVHTAYFNVLPFRKLVAYAVSTADGFRATESFKADPDFALVAKWYEEIRPEKEPTNGDGNLAGC